MRTRARPRHSLSLQRGGFFVGVIVGLLIGLALSLGVALYVTKVPVPFLDKVPQRTEEQDAAEREKNKNWDPNAPLAGKNPARPASSVAAASAPASGAPPAGIGRDPASILADRATSGPEPAGKASTPVSTGSADEAFSYFVQTGAYASAEDAESQRGKLALLGYSARVTEREQSGRTVHRVRLGPFEEKVEADGTKEKLLAGGFEAVLVRAPK